MSNGIRTSGCQLANVAFSKCSSKINFPAQSTLRYLIVVIDGLQPGCGELVVVVIPGLGVTLCGVDAVVVVEVVGRTVTIGFGCVTGAAVVVIRPVSTGLTGAPLPSKSSTDLYLLFYAA